MQCPQKLSVFSILAFLELPSTSAFNTWQFRFSFPKEEPLTLPHEGYEGLSSAHVLPVAVAPGVQVLPVIPFPCFQCCGLLVLLCGLFLFFLLVFRTC